MSHDVPQLNAHRTLFVDEDENTLAELDAVIWPHLGATIEIAKGATDMVVKDVRLNAPFQDGAEVYVVVVLTESVFGIYDENQGASG